jgi:arylsulfatase A-like enzyme
MTDRWKIGLQVAGLAAGWILLASCAPDTRPSVLLITVDTLRLDRVSCYGGPPENTPGIDRMAAGGVRFAAVQAPRGLTWPSLTTVLTGLHPRTHQVRLNGAMLDESFETLPEILQDAGYDTGGFLANMCDAPNRGLDTFFCAWWEKSGPPAQRQRKQWDSHEQPAWDAAITREAERFIRAGRNRPFFAWVHYIDPHKPFDPVPEHLRDAYDGSFPVDDDSLARLTLAGESMTAGQREQLMAVYDSQVAGVDAHISRLLQVLEDEGLAGNTVVVFTADHGEELGDHNAYFYHLSSVYQQVLALPLILRWPGHLPEGRVVEAPVAAVDLAPTVLGLLEVPAGDAMEGASRAALARGEPGARGAETTYAEWSDQMVIVGEGSWRYIWNPNRVTTYGAPFKRGGEVGFEIAAEELYDLAGDPLQQENVVAANPETATALRRKACAFVTETDFHKKATRAVDPDVRERLRALGYLQGEDDEEPARNRLESHCETDP